MSKLYEIIGGHLSSNLVQMNQRYERTALVRWLRRASGPAMVQFILDEMRLRNLLHNANLSGVNLQDVDLRNANLRQADLQQADLRGANLSNADLCGANLTGAQLEDVLGLDTVKHDADTIGTDGLPWQTASV